MVKRKDPSQNILVMIIIITFFIGISFLSPGITGNVVSGLSRVFLNWTGILLLVIGLIEILFILIRNKNFQRTD